MSKGLKICIPILMYHSIEDEDHPAGPMNRGEQLYVLHTSQFRNQMLYLKQEGYKALLLKELQTLDEWPDKAVILTFDDGHASNYTLALPILQEFGFKAEFFITTAWIGAPYYMTVEQIRGLHESGMGIGSHGVTHRFLSDLDNESLEKELRHSMEALCDVVEGEIISLSYPGGRMNSLTTAMAITEGYKYICSSEPRRHVANSRLKTIPRFTISTQVSMEAFVSLLLGNASFLLSTRYRVLALMKTILGNKRYETMRGFLLGQKPDIHMVSGFDE